MTFSYETRTNKDGSTTYTKLVTIGVDPITGKRRQQRISADTVRELKKQYTAKLHQVQTGTLADAGKRTVKEFLAYWLDKYAKGAVKPTTFDRYEQMVNAHINPAIGHIRLDKLTPTDLAMLYRHKLDGGRLDGKPGGLSPRTVRYIHATIHEALGHAVRWGMVIRNVADAVDAPKQQRHEMKTWTAEHINQFVAVASAERYGPVFELAILTGLRRGELLGLRWQDVDTVRGVVNVTQTLIERGAALSFSTPKTHRSRRPVTLSESAVTLLKAQRVRQVEERLRLGSAWTDHDLVFTSEVGTPVHPRNLFRTFKRAIVAAGVPDIRFHDLRHTHATLLFQADVHPKIVSERLGHATIGLTLDTYSHTLPGMQSDAMDKLDAMLARRREPA